MISDVPNMCEACLKLVDAPRYVMPHPALQWTSEKTTITDAGPLSQSRYQCGQCGRKWVYEHDVAGHGWKMSVTASVLKDSL